MRLMREIKFRVWSEYRKEMRPVQHLEATEDGSFRLSENFQLLQYTGLKDKNGKEIYEGDILHQHNGHQRLRKTVRFQQVQNKNYTNSGFNGWNVVSGQSWEIIGNICSNPELLTPNA